MHLDADKLRRDGLHLEYAANLASTLSATGFDAQVEIIDARETSDLAYRLGKLAEADRVFDVVIAIGHSNADGIVVAANMPAASWTTFASYLKPFEPRRLVLVACEAGRWPSADVLFTKLPKLRRIFASPVNTSKALATFMLAVVPYVVGVKAPRRQTITWTQTAAIAITGGQFREWKRDDDKGNAAGVLLDLAAQVADPYVRQVPGLLRKMLG